MEHLLGAGSNLLNATVHLRSSPLLCGSPWKNLTDIRHLPQLKLMITIQMTFACYDIPFVQKMICTLTSIHPRQLVFPPSENDFPAQVITRSCTDGHSQTQRVPRSPTAPQVSSSGKENERWGPFRAWARLGGFRDTFQGERCTAAPCHGGRERVLSRAWLRAAVWQGQQAASCRGDAQLGPS